MLTNEQIEQWLRDAKRIHGHASESTDVQCERVISLVTELMAARRLLEEKAHGARVQQPHDYDNLIKPRDGSHDVGAIRPW